MAISPPSDIVLEVSQAADPDRLKVASAKLEKLSAGAGTAFAQVMDKIEQALPTETAAASKVPPGPLGPSIGSLPFDMAQARLDMRNDLSRLQNAAHAASTTKNDRAKSLQEFEAVVLRTFIASMLPQDAENVYGEGTAGDVWKGMMAEQIANQMAKAGGIGIADRIMASRLPGSAGKQGTDMAGLGLQQRPDISSMSPSSLSAILSASARI
jgi:peptidoglycan hydrolase FlgJ